MPGSWILRWMTCCAGPGTQRPPSPEGCHVTSGSAEHRGPRQGVTARQAQRPDCPAVDVPEKVASGSGSGSGRHVSSGGHAASRGPVVRPGEGRGLALESSTSKLGQIVQLSDHTAALDGFPELWAEILQRVPELGRLRHVPLVSRRFLEASRDPSLWPKLCITVRDFRTAARWRSFLRWLAVHAVGLHTLEFGYGHSIFSRVHMAYTEEEAAELASSRGRRAPELIALLAATAPQLRNLDLRYPWLASDDPHLALPAELGGLSQLTSLTLGWGEAPVTAAQVDAMVRGLPSLQHLALLNRKLFGMPLDGFPVGIATSCGQLRHLRIHAAKLGAVPPELGRLTAPTRLDLQHASVTSLPDSISRLSALKEINLKLNRDTRLPPGLTACRQLTQLDMDSDSVSPVLASLHTLRRLHVSTPYRVLFPDQPPHEMYWTHLRGLTELQLQCGDRYSQGLVPAELGGMTGLRKLCIYGAQLQDLPGGPYLSRLESLRMEECTFIGWMPVRLAAATQLRHLEIEKGREYICLDAADVAMLSSLPALIRVSVRV